MKLFLSPGTCSLSPHIVLEETGLPYETEWVDLATKQTANGVDFKTINPKGYVPALLLKSGDLLTEGPAIIQYVADQVPEKKLAPANGTLERYRLQGWLSYIATELHKVFTPFFNPASSEDWREAAKANLGRHLTFTDKHLAQHNYLMGDNFSIADAYLFTVLTWPSILGIDLSPWPNVQAFQARISARPAVQAVLKAERLI